jgi:hypothetical protein
MVVELAAAGLAELDDIFFTLLAVFGPHGTRRISSFRYE